MADEGTLDRKTIGAVVLAVSAFVALGIGVAVWGAPAEPTPVLAGRPTPTTSVALTSTVSTSAVPTSAVSTSAVPTGTGEAPPETLEVVFDAMPGLGFERERRWTYDVETQVLENVVVFEPDRVELLVTYSEVLPASLLALGAFDFDPLTDDVTTASDGTKTYKFDLSTSVDDPGELVWSVTIEAPLSADELDQLADDRNEAEAQAIESVQELLD